MRDMIADGSIERLGLRKGVPLRPTPEDIAAHEGEVARREGQVPEASSQAGLPLSTPDLFEDSITSTPKPDRSKAAREADVTPWKRGCFVPSPARENLFDGPDFRMKEKKLQAGAEAFARYVKQLPRRKPVKKQTTGVWLQKLPKLAVKSHQEGISQDADSQETQSLGLFA